MLNFIKIPVIKQINGYGFQNKVTGNGFDFVPNFFINSPVTDVSYSGTGVNVLYAGTGMNVSYVVTGTELVI